MHFKPKATPPKVGTAMNQIDANKALILSHYESAVIAYQPSVIDRQVAPDFVDHGHPERAGPECVKAQRGHCAPPSRTSR
jgi:hypothetical protein